MDWLNNANTLVSLVVGLLGIGGALYGAVSYLKTKASRIPANIRGSSVQPSRSSTRTTTSVPAFTWMEWSELLAQGLVDTMDFALHIFFRDSEQDEEMSIMSRILFGLFFCGIGIGIGTLILGIIIDLLLTGLGIPNASGAAGVIAFIMLFTLLCFIYLYHVGCCIEQKRREQYQSMKQQQAQRTSVQR